MKRLLFLSGTARAGTSALVNILNQHNHILMGQERYFFKFRKNVIVRGHFERGRFLNMRPDDTHDKATLAGVIKDPEARYDNAVYIGDKFPPMFRHLDHVFKHFPKARHIYILRNPLSVAESYEARFQNKDDKWTQNWEVGLEAWNESVRIIADLPEERLQHFTFVQYEEIYATPKAINALFTRLGLSNLEEEVLEPYTAKFAELIHKPVPRRDDIRLQVSRRADWDSYRKLGATIETRY